MKQIKTLLIAAILILGANQTISAQTKTAHVVPESLAYYRVRNNSISASKLELIKHNFAVYTQFHGYNFIKASFCLIGFLVVQLLIKPRFKK